MATYGYARVSTTAQAEDGESLAVQQRQIEGWCAMQGTALTAMHIERGVSGSVPVQQRPEGAALWRRLRKGDTVIAPKLDRLFRSALDALQTVEDLQARGVHLVLLDLGGDISGNGLAKLFLTIAAAFAEAERERIRERVTAVKRDQAQRGRYLGGKVPYGFAVGANGALESLPEQQAAIARALALRGEGKPLRTIQSALASECGERLSLGALARIVRKRPVSPALRHGGRVCRSW